MSTIISIGTAVPQYSAKQSTILEFMKTAYNDDTASRKLNILFNNSGIHTRYSVLPDFGNNQTVNSFFNVNLQVPNVAQRLTVFKENAASLAGNEVNEIVMKASEKLKTDPSAIDKWAIHPGGKKILDSIKNQMQLSDSDMQYSYKVLSDYGNLSSPTILFVLNEIIQAKHTEGEIIFSIGFGPGLSIETALLTYVTNRFEKSNTNEIANSTKLISHVGNNYEVEFFKTEI